jgi:hypothetical protein
VQAFFGVNASIQSEDLAWNYGIWVRDSPPNLLPIAGDSGGSVFCLSVYGDDVGKVYYWDYYREPHPVRTRYPWIYPVADSLEDFLNSLREPLPEELGPSEGGFVWRTDCITAEIRRDDQFLDIGQYLNLDQRLPSGELGWTNAKVRLPESWSVQDLHVADGAVTITVRDGRCFRLTRYNFPELDFAILAGGPKSEEQLDRLWSQHAQVVEPPRLA